VAVVPGSPSSGSMMAYSEAAWHGQRNCAVAVGWIDGACLAHARLAKRRQNDLYSLSRSWPTLVGPLPHQTAQSQPSTAPATFTLSNLACMARRFDAILPPGTAPSWLWRLPALRGGGQRRLHLGEAPMQGEPHCRPPGHLWPPTARPSSRHLAALIEKPTGKPGPLT